MLSNGYANTNDAAATMSYGSNANHVSDRIALLDDEIAKIQGATERVRNLIAQTRSIADGVFGSQPSSSEKSTGIGQSVAGRADGLRSATVGLHDALSTLDIELGRLNAL